MWQAVWPKLGLKPMKAVSCSLASLLSSSFVVLRENPGLENCKAGGENKQPSSLLLGLVTKHILHSTDQAATSNGAAGSIRTSSGTVACCLDTATGW